MRTKLNEIFAVLAESLEDLSNNIDKESSSYQFEATFNDLLYGILVSRFFNLWLVIFQNRKMTGLPFLQVWAMFVFTKAIALQLPRWV